MLDDLLLRENFFQKFLNGHFSLLDLPGFVIGDPGGLRELIFQDQSILFEKVFLQLQQLSVPEEKLLLDCLDADFNNVNCIFEHVVIAFISAKYLHLRQEIESCHLLQELYTLSVFNITQSSQFLKSSLLCFHQLIEDLLDEAISLFLIIAKEGAVIALSILNCKRILIEIMLLIGHDVGSSIFEGNCNHEFFLSVTGLLCDDDFSADEIQGRLDNLDFIGYDSHWLFQNKLYSWLRNHMWQQKLLLYLVYLIVVQDAVELFIVTLVHFFKESEDTAYVIVIWMGVWRSSFDLLHDQHIFWQSLYWFYQEIFDGKQFVRWIEPSLIQKVGEMFPFHQAINQRGACGIIVQVLKVHFKEMDFLLHLLENDLVVPVLIGFFKDSHEKELVQSSYLVNVHEYCLRFFFGDYLLVEQLGLEV